MKGAGGRASRDLKRGDGGTQGGNGVGQRRRPSILVLESLYDLTFWSG